MYIFFFFVCKTTRVFLLLVWPSSFDGFIISFFSSKEEPRENYLSTINVDEKKKEINHPGNNVFFLLLLLLTDRSRIYVFILHIIYKCITTSPRRLDPYVRIFVVLLQFVRKQKNHKEPRITDIHITSRRLRRSIHYILIYPIQCSRRLWVEVKTSYNNIRLTYLFSKRFIVVPGVLL